MKKKLSVVVITLTPFDEEGCLDEAAYRRQLGRLRQAGVSVYVAGSGSSEGYTLTPEELDRVLAISVEELKGHVPFRAMGCEPRIPREMIQFMRQAEKAKVDAAQIFSLDIGHGSKPSKEELESYYSSVIESTSLPIYLSSHQSAGYHLPLDLI
jgi:4-hydroxy-tetrahydrodipicolinate synthase